AEFADLIPKGLTELKYIQDEFIKFAKERTLKKVLSDKSEAIDAGNFDELFYELKHQSKKFNYATGGLVSDRVFSLQNLREIYDEKGGIKTGVAVNRYRCRRITAKATFDHPGGHKRWEELSAHAYRRSRAETTAKGPPCHFGDELSADTSPVLR